VELFVRKKNTTKTKISASQRISVKNCMNYDHNKNVGLFKFPSGYRKLYLNSPKGYSQKIIKAQTAYAFEMNFVTYMKCIMCKTHSWCPSITEICALKLSIKWVTST